MTGKQNGELQYIRLCCVARGVRIVQLEVLSALQLLAGRKGALSGT